MTRVGIDARIAVLAQQAVELKRRIEALRLPRNDRGRKALEYELTKLKLDLRELRAIRHATIDRRPGPKRLIPYAGADYK
jgi:hypothetical protein